MKGLVYHGPDAVIRVTATTICGTDLHILKGDVPKTAAGRMLGHDQFRRANGGSPVMTRAAALGAEGAVQRGVCRLRQASSTVFADGAAA